MVTLSDKLKHIPKTLYFDAEILLAFVLKKPRSYLYTQQNEILSAENAAQFDVLLAHREQGKPLAYLTGHKEFWSIELIVTPDVLIPRPETEHLIEWALEHLPQNKNLLLADLGTGSGAIAIALARSVPQWKVHATDISKAALAVAEKNITRWQCTQQINLYLGSWCTALPEKKYDAIFSNPPYIAEKDPHLTALSYEPYSALVAAQNGLQDLQTIIKQAKEYLVPGGWLVVEHGFDQAEAVLNFFNVAKYQNSRTFLDFAGLPRFSAAHVAGQRRAM